MLYSPINKTRSFGITSNVLKIDKTAQTDDST